MFARQFATTHRMRLECLFSVILATLRRNLERRILRFRRTLSVLANHLISRSNAFVTSKTDTSSLRRLISSLSPVATDKQLVRFGPPGDGGYLIPDDLRGIEACFSPGVSVVSGFEKQCAEAGMAVYLADASVESAVESHPRFAFTKKFIGVTRDDTFMTIDDWVAGSLPDTTSDLLLQIDIEGYEYEVFLGMSDALLRRFRIIVAEFHGLDQLWNRSWFAITSRAFEKVTQTHACVHIHPNNRSGALKMRGIEIPRAAEFTFLRRDRILRSSPATNFPHLLDQDNATNARLPLPACWVNAGASVSRR
jgi:hypothetical protein